MALFSIAEEHQCSRRMYCLHILFVSGPSSKFANDMGGVSGIGVIEDKSSQPAVGKRGCGPTLCNENCSF